MRVLGRTHSRVPCLLQVPDFALFERWAYIQLLVAVPTVRRCLHSSSDLK